MVLHELAHVHNRDLDRTFLTVAVWRAFVAIAVVPMGLAIGLRLLLLPGGLQARTTDLQVAWRLVALAVLVLLIRNAILRSRELYADIRTAQWGARDTLRRLFAEPAGAPVPAGAARRLTASVLWAFHTHPEPGVRREVVTGAVVPLDAGPWDGAVLGVVATFAAESIQLTAAWLEGGGWNDGLLSIASLPITLLIAVPLAMACGIVVSRVVMAAQVTGIPFGLDRFAVGLGVGLVAGAVLGPSAASLPPGVALRGQPALAPGSWALWIALAVVLCLFSVRWLEVVTRIWLPRIRGRVSANWLPALVGSAAAVVIGVWLPLLLEFPVFVVIGHELVFPDLPETAVAATVIVLVLPTAAGEALGRLAGLPDAGLLALLTGLWVVPLVGSLLTRGDAAALPGWAALDPIPSGRRLVVARLRPGGAVRVGLLTSAVVVLTLAACYGVLFTWVRGTRALAVLVVLLPIGVTVLASVVSAARAAASAAELRSLHGLIAASVGSAATLVGSHAALTLSSCALLRACVLPISFRSTASLALTYSILVGSVAAWLAGAVIERRRELGGASVSGRGPGRWARLGRRLALVLGGVVIVVLAEGLAVVTLGLASFVVIPLLLLAGGTGVGLWSGRVGLLGAFAVVMGANGTIALLVPRAAVLVLFVLLSHLVAIGVGYSVGRRVRRALSRP